MAIVLRDYQEEIIQNVRTALKRSRRILLQAPTGAGKTALASFMTGQTAERGAPVWFICHRTELVEQTSKTFSKFGIHHGFIAANCPNNANSQTKVCSIDTLKNRLDRLTPPKLAIIDEAHHASAAGWAVVIDWLTANGALVVGLSATPQRLDGKGLDAHFDDIVLGPSVAWLIEEGHLSPFDIYAPHKPDMTGVRKAMGDFAKGEAAEKMDKPKLTGDMIAHWLKYANGMRTIGFGVTVPHSRHMADQFCLAGIKAAHLDGDTPKNDRKRIIQEYASGELMVLFNVGLFGEGFDLSAIAQTDVTIDAVIDAAPTMSLAAYLQRGGRMLRPYPGKVGIYMDHAGNSGRHGFFDDEREWSLEGKPKGKKADNDNVPPPPVTCEHCFMQIRRPLPPACPGCGKLLQKEFKPPEVAEGELVKIGEREKAQLRAQLKREQYEAQTLDELVALAAKRGYKNPVTWAGTVFAGRRRK